MVLWPGHAHAFKGSGEAPLLLQLACVSIKRLQRGTVASLHGIVAENMSSSSQVKVSASKFDQTHTLPSGIVVNHSMPYRHVLELTRIQALKRIKLLSLNNVLDQTHSATKAFVIVKSRVAGTAPS